MDYTARLALPYLSAQQAQKHITYNEAMKALDALVQLSVKSRTTGAPPGSPAAGDAYIVPASATGGWAGKDHKIAVYLDGAWAFRDAAAGWLAYVIDAAEIVIFGGSTWSQFVTNGGSAVSKFGINATADLTDRLSVASAASLFSHDGTDHRLKINKSAAGSTASVLWQDASSGRAEIGLAGDDDLHVKVSADGSSWTEALKIARTGGLVTLPVGQLGFPATQNPSANANTLDDYEEGTFTPTIIGDAAAGAGTYSQQIGRYTKIGNVVTFQIRLAWSAHTGTGNMKISGLPFTAAANDCPVSLAFSGWAFGTGHAQGYVEASATTIILAAAATGGAFTSVPLDTAATLLASGSYFV